MNSGKHRHLSDLYDALFTFESERKTGHYPIHKSISIAGKTLLEWIVDKISMKPGLRVLDAGCGTGHTLFRLQSYMPDIDGVGISISKREVDFAKRMATAENSILDFQHRNMEVPLDDLGKFDIIFAIESLKHTSQPVRVIHSLCEALKEGGQLVVVDDYLHKNHFFKRINEHKKLWNAPGFISRDNMAELLADREDITYDTIDLSQHIKTKAYWHIMVVERLLKLMIFMASNFGIKHRNLLTYRGAMLLELLHKQQLAGYYFWIIKKKK